ncbi:MAG: ferrous iron transport protein A [Proteobacteria bacterium]|nr:ferrous iron transport protein A [Pseudomonadota bacterium]
MRSLADIPHHKTVTVVRVGGERRFRRRLLEMGLTPGTAVKVLKVAPLGDPIEIEARHSHLSIRLREAESIEVKGKAKTGVQS